MRRSSIFNTVAVACLLYGVAALRLSPQPSSAQAAQPQNPQGTTPKLQPASTTLAAAAKPADIAPLHPSATPATQLYTAKRGESIPAVAHQYLQKTSYLTASDLAEAIRKINGNRSSNVLKAAEQITIPGILAEPIVEKTIPIPRDFEVRAIYLTGIMAPAITDSASFATGAMSAATPSSSISRTPTAA